MTNNEELQEIIRATGAAHVAPIPYPPIRLRPHGEDLVALYWTEFRDRLERKGHEALVVLHDRLEGHEEELLERHHEVRERTANMRDREKVREVTRLADYLHDTWGLVNFRRTVLANLLWQYEVFGSVPARASDRSGGPAVREEPWWTEGDGKHVMTLELAVANMRASMKAGEKPKSFQKDVCKAVAAAYADLKHGGGQVKANSVRKRLESAVEVLNRDNGCELPSNFDVDTWWSEEHLANVEVEIERWKAAVLQS